MTRNVIGLPPGFRDLLFDEAESRRKVENSFAEVFTAAQYREIMPSGVEMLDVYTKGHQGALEKAFRFLDRDDNLLALRADFTPAVARIVAAGFRGTHDPLRIWYSGPVFRKADRLRGQFHEFNQVGAELIGVQTIDGDAELLDVALTGLVASGVNDACVHVSHAGIFRGIVRSLRLVGPALDKVKTEIDRKDMRGLADRLTELDNASGFKEQFQTLAGCIGGMEVLDRAERVLDNPESRKGIAELRMLASQLPDLGGRLVFDLTEIDEMEYYTGLMCTFFSPSHSGELGHGGRYDSLLKEFGADFPAIGFSLSVDRIAECL
jgi:ATP phosphoribosyltransferase regulatory subunit